VTELKRCRRQAETGHACRRLGWWRVWDLHPPAWRMRPDWNYLQRTRVVDRARRSDAGARQCCRRPGDGGHGKWLLVGDADGLDSVSHARTRCPLALGFGDYQT